MELLFLHAALMLVGVVSVRVAIDWIVSCIREDGVINGWTTYKEWRNVRQLHEYERWAQVVVNESAPGDVPTGEIPVIRIEGS